jgi:hypothetical protein
MEILVDVEGLDASTTRRVGQAGPDLGADLCDPGLA